jgi:spore germination protein YaaH
MKDFMSTNDQEIREQTLKSNATRPHQAFNEHEEQIMMQEEAHYHHTIHEFVELIVLYGWDKVQGDLRNAVFEKAW